MPTVNAPKPSSTVATALCVTVAVVMPVFLFGGLAVQITDELHMGVGAIGLIAGLYFAVCGLTAVPAGRCVERFGVPFAARLAVGLTAGSMLAIAAAAHDPVVLTALLLLSAPANGLGQIAANTVLADWAPKRRKGMLFGAKQAAVPLCTMLGGLSVPAVALTFGWRWAFVAAAAFALLALVPVAGLGPLAPHGRRGGDGRGADRRLLVLAVAVCLGSGAANPLGSFLTTYAVDIGASEAFAGLNLTVGGLAGVIARVAVGAIADRRGGELGLITVMLLGGAAGIATFTAGQPWLLPLGTAAGFALGWAWPGLMNFAVTKRYPHAPAAASSITQTGVYAGGAVGPIAFGLIADHGGWNAAWIAACAAMAAAAALIVLAGAGRAAEPGR